MAALTGDPSGSSAAGGAPGAAAGEATLGEAVPAGVAASPAGPSSSSSPALAALPLSSLQLLGWLLLPRLRRWRCRFRLASHADFCKRLQQAQPGVVQPQFPAHHAPSFYLEAAHEQQQQQQASPGAEHRQHAHSHNHDAAQGRQQQQQQHQAPDPAASDSAQHQQQQQQVPTVVRATREQQQQQQQQAAFKRPVVAYHGTSCENLHSILNNGLLNLSGTRLMRTGAAFGNGIYLSTRYDLAWEYAKPDHVWPHCGFGYKVRVLLVCEVDMDLLQPGSGTSGGAGGATAAAGGAPGASGAPANPGSPSPSQSSAQARSPAGCASGSGSSSDLPKHYLIVDRPDALRLLYVLVYTDGRYPGHNPYGHQHQPRTHSHHTHARSLHHNATGNHANSSQQPNGIFSSSSSSDQHNQQQQQQQCHDQGQRRHPGGITAGGAQALAASSSLRRYVRRVNACTVLVVAYVAFMLMSYLASNRPLQRYVKLRLRRWGLT